jgi:hypothetical protein
MSRLTVLNCIAKLSVKYADFIPVSLCVCVHIGETEKEWGDTQNIFRIYYSFASTLPSPHTSTGLSACPPTNNTEVPFFRCIRICKQGLLITLHLDTYYRLYCQETGSVRATRCWLWFCTRCHNPFIASWCFCNGWVHVTFHLTLPPPILFVIKDTLRVSWRSPPSFEAPFVTGLGVNLVFIFRSSSSTTNPVCERRVDLLVCSLPLHRHYIIFRFIDS